MKITKRELFNNFDKRFGPNIELMRTAINFFDNRYPDLSKVPHKFFYSCNSRGEVQSCLVCNIFDPQSQIIKIKKETLWQWYQKHGPFDF